MARAIATLALFLQLLLALLRLFHLRERLHDRFHFALLPGQLAARFLRAGLLLLAPATTAARLMMLLLVLDAVVARNASLTLAMVMMVR